MTGNTTYESFQNTFDAVFSINSECRIRFWNTACETLTGLSACRALDRKCHEIINGIDLNGNPYCGPKCHVSEALLKGKPVANYDIVIKGADGNPIMINVGAFVVPDTLQNKLGSSAFMVLRRVDCYTFIQRIKRDYGFDFSACKPSKFNLTARELEILKILSTGATTDEIADSLRISR